MKKKKLIHDPAKSLQISATNISFVFNGKVVEKLIARSVEAKMLIYLDGVGNRIGMVAQSLPTGKGRTIEMLAESNHEHVSLLINGLVFLTLRNGSIIDL